MLHLLTLIHILSGTCSASGLQSAADRNLLDATPGFPMATPPESAAEDGIPFDAAVLPLQLTGKPVPYMWGFDTLTKLGQDAARYEEQLSELLLSPLSDWELFERDEYTLGVRPIETDGQADVVGLLQGEYKTPGGRDFFEWLVGVEGFVLIDPFTEENNLTYSTPVRAEGPNGAEVYANAQLTQFAATPDQPAIFLTAFHFHTCGPNVLQYYVYPAAVPFEFRTPSVQAETGAAPEITAVFGFRLDQIDPDTIRMTSVAWIYFPPPIPLSQTVRAASLDTFYAGVHERIQAHLQVTLYSPATGDECATDRMGMDGVYGGVDGMYGG